MNKNEPRRSLLSAGPPLAVLVAVMAMMGCSGVSLPFRKTDLVDFTPRGTLQSEHAFHNYGVRIYRDQNSGGSFEILRNNNRVYGRKGWQFQIGNIEEINRKDKNSLVDIGKDITGNGEPNLVVSEWTGGAHCCFIYYIFEIGNRFRQIGIIDAAHGGVDFRDLDGDSSLEVSIHDWTFAYWRTSFADSPAPRVILRYQAGSYRVAPDLMREPAPAFQQLERWARQIRESDRWKTGEPPSELWRAMLDLIYSGQAGSAWRLFEIAWNPDVRGKTEFLHDFRSRLSESRYWPEVKALSSD